jgi:hypothetical protein
MARIFSTFKVEIKIWLLRYREPPCNFGGRARLLCCC